MPQNIWQFLVGLAICVAGLIILYLGFASNAANPTVANTGSYFFELGLGLALGGGIWAVIQVRQALGLAKPEESGEPRTPEERSDIRAEVRQASPSMSPASHAHPRNGCAAVR